MDTPWGSVGDGWRHLVQPLIDMCELENATIQQIKEKFGTLRFYVAYLTKDGNELPGHVLEAITVAEIRSASVCETCGGPGKIKDVGGWLKCICNDQFLEWVAEVRANKQQS